ncbi:hypothetical protein BDQ12DRAFT_213601 [Crucibulum laeve]|uniref:Uncharacterized protein n=1 Tax=Crucibulum laeve TaxID=68775 RepID=A0A5C3LWV4_9AGAR|nr:hypothetical protein BDQ12DRAFT_213601 [Crucibulum laeve]
MSSGYAPSFSPVITELSFSMISLSSIICMCLLETMNQAIAYVSSSSSHPPINFQSIHPFIILHPPELLKLTWLAAPKQPPILATGLLLGVDSEGMTRFLLLFVPPVLRSSTP